MTALRRRLQDRVDHYAPGRAQRTARARRRLAALSGGRPMRVLDAGCEEGDLALDLAAAHPGWAVHGVDLREEPVRVARERAAAAGLPATFEALDLTAPWTGGQHDAAACLECLVEVPDDAAAVRTLAAAVRPGGVLLVQVPVSDWRPLLSRSAATWKREARHGYRADELRTLLESGGFTDVQVRPAFRRLAQLAQELRDATKTSSLRRRLLLLPLLRLLVALDSAGLTVGPPRAWFVEARRR